MFGQQSDFLLCLAKRGGDGAVVAGIDAAAGKRDLAGMFAQAGIAERQQNAGIGPIGDRDQHRRRYERIGRDADIIRREGRSAMIIR